MRSSSAAAPTASPPRDALPRRGRKVAGARSGVRSRRRRAHRRIRAGLRDQRGRPSAQSCSTPGSSTGFDLASHGLAYAATISRRRRCRQPAIIWRSTAPMARRYRGSIADADQAAWRELRAKLLRFAAVLRPVQGNGAAAPRRSGRPRSAEAWQARPQDQAARPRRPARIPAPDPDQRRRCAGRRTDGRAAEGCGRLRRGAGRASGSALAQLAAASATIASPDSRGRLQAVWPCRAAAWALSQLRWPRP